MSTLLLVDDSPTQSRYLELLLVSFGHRVLAYKSKDITPENALEFSIDLALVALLIAKSNGFELGVRLRAIGVKRIAIMTKNPSDIEKKWVQAIGLSGLLDVPDTPENIDRQLRTLLRS